MRQATQDDTGCQMENDAKIHKCNVSGMENFELVCAQFEGDFINRRF